jgi:hypothetical protein
MDRRAGCRDASFPGAVALGQLREDAVRKALAAWDAWDGARQDAKADEAHRAPADEGVEKLADPAPVFQARDASWHSEQRCWLAPGAQPVSTGPCTLVAVPSAEQSSSAGAQPKLPGEPGETQLQAPRERLQQRSHSL